MKEQNSQMEVPATMNLNRIQWQNGCKLINVYYSTVVGEVYNVSFTTDRRSRYATNTYCLNTNILSSTPSKTDARSQVDQVLVSTYSKSGLGPQF